MCSVRFGLIGFQSCVSLTLCERFPVSYRDLGFDQVYCVMYFSWDRSDL